LLTALQIGGIGRDEVTFVDLEGGDFDLRDGDKATREVQASPKLRLNAQALLDGRADAVYAKGAFSATLIEQHGFRPILDINEQADPLLRVNAGTPRPITVNRDLARDHPQIVALYLAVLQKTAQWAKTHPEEVVKAIAAETGATEAAVRRGFGPQVHERFTVTLSDQSVAGLRAQQEYLVREGFIKDFDFASWIDPAPLALAETLVEAVQLVPDLQPA
jgi:ABC-type nitrate/sulfonate/bicarbonate transport system substrate-binding protein